MLDHDEALEDKPTGDDHAEVHERALKRFDECVIPQQEVRAFAYLARRISVIPGALWDSAISSRMSSSSTSTS